MRDWLTFVGHGGTITEGQDGFSDG